MSSISEEIYDITIIGGGPIGLFATFYAGMRNAKTKVIESLPELGGQLATLYPEKYIYDIAGYPKIKARTLVHNLEKQIEHFHPTICLQEEVLEISQNTDGTLKILTNLREHQTRSIIITAGNGAFKPRRLNLEAASFCEGKTLHYHITDSKRFADKDVIVTGGGDSAVDWSLMLEKVAKSVTLVHRRPEFRAHEHSLELLDHSTVKVKTPYVLESLFHDAGHLQNIRIKNPKNDTTEILSTDHLIVNHGFSSALGPIKNWGLALDKNAISVESDMSTSIPGVYAAGDICTYDGKVKLIATGFGEAPTAVNNALHFIQPKTRTQPAHSTSLFKN
ncbi:NAD(P)/FAD-dependent oxidoreductase [Vagococcus entomophilus]|uniref:Ferredoxin--NADP reductase n=1 Tax=Vagococcus entomophilus TaxID=1160095 RepID=A0A430AHK1_9ENTE|nr:NAD(P)/FAD-dependent oxidoreductase [Vagococcus entomophilus]RSU07390.1 ferredoxin--NADP(+) reductase [Vagococcus entomophilus]